VVTKRKRIGINQREMVSHYWSGNNRVGKKKKKLEMIGIVSNSSPKKSCNNSL
jgi:hypothetical protein